MATTTTTFPLESKVVLHGLKAEQYNGKEAVVKSSLKEGRQEVLLGKKLLNIKPENLEYQTKPIESLSFKELKSILKECDDHVNFAGMDAADLRSQVSAMDTQQVFEALAKANAKAQVQKLEEQQQQEAKAKRPRNTNSMANQADHMANVSPEQLRQQARAMKSVPPHQIRRMHPQFAHMTDAQILEAANQMEQMADNPELLRQAADQMKHMTPEQMQQATTAAPPPPQSMDNVTPEQLLQQAQLMRGLSKDQIRSMNPQMATFSDAEIDQSIAQMEMMATNPELLDMAKTQMQDMTPEQVAEFQQQARGNSGGSGNSANSAAPPVPTKLSDMSGKDLKKLMDMVDKNPGMLKHMLPPGVNEEQFKQSFGAFRGMSDEQLDSTLKMMQTADQYTAPVREAYTKVNALCGGHLFKVLILTTIGMIYGVAYWYLAPSSSGATTSNPIAQEEPIPVMEEEDSEF